MKPATAYGLHRMFIILASGSAGMFMTQFCRRYFEGSAWSVPVALGAMTLLITAFMFFLFWFERKLVPTLPCRLQYPFYLVEKHRYEEIFQGHPYIDTMMLRWMEEEMDRSFWEGGIPAAKKAFDEKLDNLKVEDILAGYGGKQCE